MAIYVSDNTTFKWTHDGKRYLAHIRLDDNPENPRDGDQLTTMACWHRRYKLGDDVVGKMDPEDFWQSLVRETVPTEDILKAAMDGSLTGIRVGKNQENPELLDIYETYSLETVLGKTSPAEELCYEAVSSGVAVESLLDDLTISHCQTLLRPYMEWLPLYLYDHSGITMSTGSFNDPWDSGQVGFIYTSKEVVLRELCDVNEENWRETAVKLMKADVEAYDQYLTDDVYGFITYEDVDGEWEEVESVWGFFGSDILENGMLESIGFGFSTAIKSDACKMGEAVARQVTVYEF